MNAYTVHEGDGLLDPSTTLRAATLSRGDACRLAAQLVRDGARVTEVRKDRMLMDQFVRRGRTPRRLYHHTTRGGTR